VAQFFALAFEKPKFTGFFGNTSNTTKTKKDVQVGGNQRPIGQQ
jgi:hypothetical protein